MDLLVKAIEARKAGKLDEAAEWENLAKSYQSSYEYYVQAAQAYEAGNNEKGHHLDKEGERLFDNTQRSNQFLLARLSRESQQKSSEATMLTGKERVAESWSNASVHADLAFDRLAKAIEARAAGKKAEAEKWTKVAGLYQFFYDLYTQAAQAYAVGNNDEGNQIQGLIDDNKNLLERRDQEAEAEARKNSASTEITK